MAASNNFISRLDPTGQASLDASELLQMIELAMPEDNRFIGYYSPTEPNLTDNPELVRSIWLDTTTVPPTPKVRNTTLNSWVSITGGITDASQITNSIITLAKLAASEAASKGTYILRANAAGNGFELVDPTTILTANTLPIAKLLKGTDGQIPKSTATGVEWYTVNYATEINALANTVNLNVLATGGLTNKVLQTNGSGVVSLVTATDIFNTVGGLPIASISPGTGNAEKTVRVNSAGNALEFVTDPSRLVVTQLADTAMVTTAGTQTIAHNRANILWAKVCLVCLDNTNAQNYAYGDVVDTSSLSSRTIRWDTANVYITLSTDYPLYFWHRTTPNSAPELEPSKWRYRVFIISNS